MDNLRKRFGHLLAAHRRRRGLTQDGLANASGLSKDMVARIEIGKTGASFSTIERLAQTLEVDPAEFFTTELANSAKDRQTFTALTARLAPLNERDLTWLISVIDAVLRGR
jgi:transcriptional regulator with XRE-family HTH domain